MKGAPALWLSLGLMAAAANAGNAPACLTDTPAAARPAGVRPSFLFVTPEERLPVAAGSKLLLVRGEVPEPGAEELARVVEAGYRLTVGELGFASFPDRIAVSFSDLPAGAQGQLLSSARGNVAEIVLSRTLAGRPLVRALTHQVGHLALIAYGHEIGGLGEATATWIQSQLEGDGQTAREELRARLDAVGESLFHAAPQSAMGGSTFLGFLEMRLGGGAVRRIWEQAAAAPAEGARHAIEAALTGLGTSLAAQMEAYAAWLLAEARRDEATGLGEAVTVSLLGDTGEYPREGRISAGPEPLGIGFLRFDTSEVAGGLHVELTADSGAELAVAALIVPRSGSVPTARVSLPDGAAGHVDIRVPTSEAGEVVLAVVNLGAQGRLGFSYEASTDESFPYRLRRLTATSGGGVVRLFWDTASEEGLVGWTVLRSSAPDRSFVALNTVLVPGASQLGLRGGSEYMFTDTGVQAGRTYYYYLEGLTGVGLASSSHVLAVSIS